MLPKEQRLPIQLFVVKRGKLIKTPYFLLRIFTPESGFSRFGVTVSAKTANKATDRNRLKRLVYNFAKEYYKEIPVADYWITVFASAADLGKKRFLEELGRLLIPNSQFLITIY